jgi:hypothetical protein
VEKKYAKWFNYETQLLETSPQIEESDVGSVNTTQENVSNRGEVEAADVSQVVKDGATGTNSHPLPMLFEARHDSLTIGSNFVTSMIASETLRYINKIIQFYS